MAKVITKKRQIRDTINPRKTNASTVLLLQTMENSVVTTA